VEHIDGVFELGDIDDAVFTLDVKSDLSYSRSDRLDWLPVRGVVSSLYRIQLKARLASCLAWEYPEIVQ